RRVVPANDRARSVGTDDSISDLIESLLGQFGLPFHGCTLRLPAAQSAPRSMTASVWCTHSDTRTRPVGTLRFAHPTACHRRQGPQAQIRRQGSVLVPRSQVGCLCLAAPPTSAASA